MSIRKYGTGEVLGTEDPEGEITKQAKAEDEPTEEERRREQARLEQESRR
jgi:hypothetical protein